MYVVVNLVCVMAPTEERLVHLHEHVCIQFVFISVHLCLMTHIVKVKPKPFVLGERITFLETYFLFHFFCCLKQK